MTARIIWTEKKFKRRRRWARHLTVLGVAATAALSAVTVWAHHTVEQIPTFTRPDGTSEVLNNHTDLHASSWLIFSVGSQNMTEADANRLGVSLVGRGTDGLTDMIAIVVTDTDSTQVISIPRDTWIEERRTRINTIYNTDGVAALADTVEELTGIPVQHAVGMNFTAFADLIDATGGVRLRFDTPIRDLGSGFEITTPGCHHLNGAATLAWTRSRKPDIYTNNRWRRNPQASDLLRIDNRHQLLTAAAARLAQPGTVKQIPDLVSTARTNLIIDDATNLNDIITAAVAITRSGADNISYTTTKGTVTTINGASVIIPDPVSTKADPVVVAAHANIHNTRTRSNQDEPGARTRPEDLEPDQGTSRPAPGPPDPEWGVGC